MPLTHQAISDRVEIQDLLVCYCYAVDNRDAYRTVFTADAVIDDMVTGGVRSGVEEHVTFMKRALSIILISQHAISTILFDLRGDEAVMDAAPPGRPARRALAARTFRADRALTGPVRPPGQR